jgi:hypothetical protein
MWSKQVGRLDWVVIAVTAALAVVTVYAASFPVVGTDAFYLLMFGWPLPAIGWSLLLLRSADHPTGRATSAALLVGSILSVPLSGLSLFVVFLAGWMGIGLVVVAGLALFGVVVAHARHRRIAWLAAPTIVVLTLVLLYTGLPSLIRVSLAEPALTAYAEQIERGEAVQELWYGDDPISVGGIPIYEVYRNRGHVQLVTGYVGILADDGAGLAYLPSGLPDADPRYEHLVGPWYRWYPY